MSRKNILSRLSKLRTKESELIKILESYELKLTRNKNYSNIESLVKRKNSYTDSLRQVSNEINRLSKLASKLRGGIHVTDHAIVRYLERVKGIDLSIIKDEILSDSLVSAIDAFKGSGEFPILDGTIKAVVRNNTIVTIRK